MMFVNSLAWLAIFMAVSGNLAVVYMNAHDRLREYHTNILVDLAGIIGVLWLVFG